MLRQGCCRSAVLGIAAALLLTGCAATPSYRAAFTELDGDAGGTVEWHEFKARFQEATPKAFMAADADKDGRLQPAEWERFQELQPSPTP